MLQAEFKRQKSLLIEKELQAHFIRAKNARAADEDLPRPRPTSATRPTLRSEPLPLEASTGRAASRFAAAHPKYQHPVVHPGAMARPASEPRLRRAAPEAREPRAKTPTSPPAREPDAGRICGIKM